MSSLPLHLLRPTSGFSRDPRFASVLAAEPAPQPDCRQEPEGDPLAEAYQRGYAAGAAAARAEAEQAEQQREAARRKIELAFARFDEQSAIQLRERLRQTVLALCEETVLPLSLDPAGLAARIDKAVAMLQRAQGERRVLLNPHDLELVKNRLSPDLIVEADPDVERGAFRVETPDGGIEDGPEQWRGILAEMFREC